MPKADYTGKIDEFDKIISERCGPTHYMGYATDLELTMRPTKATDTLDFFTISFMTSEALNDKINKLEEMGYFISRPTTFCLNIDRK